MNKEEMKKEIEKLEKIIEDASNKINEISNKLDGKEVRFKPKMCQRYYYIDTDGDIVADICDDDENNDCLEYLDTIHEYRYFTRNVFESEEKAEQRRELIELYNSLKDFAEDISEDPINWNDTTTKKHFIKYDYTTGRLKQFGENCDKQIGQIYSSNRNFLKLAKEQFGEDNLIDLFQNY